MARVLSLPERIRTDNNVPFCLECPCSAIYPLSLVGEARASVLSRSNPVNLKRTASMRECIAR